MIYRGEALVPPNCPAARSNWEIVDVGATVMRFNSYDCEYDDAGNPTTTETFVSFSQATAEEPFIEPSSLIVPIGSEVSDQAHRLADEIESGDGTRLEKMQRLLHDRIVSCRGVVDGECWALGPNALSEAIGSVMDEPA